jgi:hypothetical protein
MCKKINLTPNTGNTMPYGIPYPPYVFQPTTVNNSTKKKKKNGLRDAWNPRKQPAYLQHSDNIQSILLKMGVGKIKKSPSTWLIIHKLFAPNTIKYIYITLQVLAGPIEMSVSN